MARAETTLDKQCSIFGLDDSVKAAIRGDLERLDVGENDMLMVSMIVATYYSASLIKTESETAVSGLNMSYAEFDARIKQLQSKIDSGDIALDDHIRAVNKTINDQLNAVNRTIDKLANSAEKRAEARAMEYVEEVIKTVSSVGGESLAKMDANTKAYADKLARHTSEIFDYCSQSVDAMNGTGEKIAKSLRAESLGISKQVTQEIKDSVENVEQSIRKTMMDAVQKNWVFVRESVFLHNAVGAALILLIFGGLMFCLGGFVSVRLATQEVAGVTLQLEDAQYAAILLRHNQRIKAAYNNFCVGDGVSYSQDKPKRRICRFYLWLDPKSEDIAPNLESWMRPSTESLVASTRGAIETWLQSEGVFQVFCMGMWTVSIFWLLLLTFSWLVPFPGKRKRPTSFD